MTSMVQNPYIGADNFFHPHIPPCNIHDVHVSLSCPCHPCLLSFSLSSKALLLTIFNLVSQCPTRMTTMTTNTAITTTTMTTTMTATTKTQRTTLLSLAVANWPHRFDDGGVEGLGWVSTMQNLNNEDRILDDDDGWRTVDDE